MTSFTGLVRREALKRAFSSAAGVVRRLGPVHRDGRQPPVKRELREAIARVVAVELLERLRDLLVHARPAGRAEALVQRLVDERVGEAELPHVLGRLAQHGRRDGRLQAVEQPTLIHLGGGREKLKLKRAADHRREPQYLLGLLAEALHAALDHLANTLGQRYARRSIDAPAPAGLVEAQRPGLREATQYLRHEERVAVGLAAICVANSRPYSSSSVPGDGRHEKCHLVNAEAMERDPLHPLNRPQIRQRPAQRVILAQIRVAVGHDQLERPLLDRAHHVLEQSDRLPVGPVQVVEHHAHRHAPRHFCQESRDGREQQVALGLRVRRLALGQILTALARLRASRPSSPPWDSTWAASKLLRDVLHEL